MVIAIIIVFGYNPILRRNGAQSNGFSQTMKKISNFYVTMPDGTIKHTNPLNGTEVWTVSTRANRPHNHSKINANVLHPIENENYCDFCQSSYFKTPPEKARLIQSSENLFEKIENLSPDCLDSSKALFRRIGNLFEIVTYDYWLKNHDFHLSPAQNQWKQKYLENPAGRSHVLKMVETKLSLSGRTVEEISKLAEDEKMTLSNAFFGGAHELIIAGRHYVPNAQFDDQLCSSGELTPAEHYQFMRFTVDAMKDIYANNRYVRYVTIFQNWLRPAGASLDHLHKQLVGIDEWGASIESEMEMVRENPNIYNELVVNFSADHNLIFAENDYAVALSEIGHRYPTLAIYSKSVHTRPEEHTEEEMSGFSDLVHACHAAMGSQIPCNEEWYFSPRDAIHVMPWHLLIKWRTINQAGFEGGTKIYINPVSPEALRDQMVPKLYELRDAGKIKNLRIATECELKPNPLLYYKNAK
jgi:galactose-1-phosphate uridylyltransferase